MPEGQAGPGPVAGPGPCARGAAANTVNLKAAESAQLAKLKPEFGPASAARAQFPTAGNIIMMPGL